MTRLVRVLVAEDFEPFRDLLCAVLQESPELRVICKVSNGLDAVQKAKQLQPDLILLDVGLPKLSGIEAARRIRQASTDSKIMFVSQHSSVDVVQEAFRAGACGYVVKSDVGRELLEAVHRVLKGEQFLGMRFADQIARVLGSAKAAALRDKGVARRYPWLERNVKAAHEMHLYLDDDDLLGQTIRFVEQALERGNAVVLIATETHRHGLMQRSQARDLLFVAAMAEGRLTLLDAAEILALFMINELPNPDRFMRFTTGLIAGAAKALKGKDARVIACGECAPLLWAQGNAEGAIRLEQLWDRFAAAYSVDILCHYPVSSFATRKNNQMFQRIFAGHSAVHGQ